MQYKSGYNLKYRCNNDDMFYNNINKVSMYLMQLLEMMSRIRPNKIKGIAVSSYFTTDVV